MAGQQGDAGTRGARNRPWIRQLANVGFVLVGGAAVTEMVTAGSARWLVGLLLLAALLALIPAGATRVMERRKQPLGVPAGPPPESTTTRASQPASGPTQAPTPPPNLAGLREKWAGGGSAQPSQPVAPAAMAPVEEPREQVTLPRLSELSDVALGATPTRYTERGRQAPYVKRPATDDRLASLLKAVGTPYPFVVVVGPSKSGKSRTAVEAVRSMFGSRDPNVLVRGHTGALGHDSDNRQPSAAEALAELMRSDTVRPPERRPWLVWLDDLTAGDLSYLSSDVLERASQQAVLVATMTDTRWRQVMSSSGEVTATARAALARATKVSLDFSLTEAERAEAAQLYPHEQIGTSLAETLVGGAILIERFRDGRDTEPAGFAIVQAAVDARRAGLNRPITETELRNLYPLYLRRVRIDLDPTTALFEAGMAWATEPVTSGVALLRPAGSSGAYEVFDHLASDHAGTDATRFDDTEDPFAGPIPDAMWRELVAAVPLDDAFTIGVGAYVNDNVVAAEAAFRKVATDHAGQAPRAALSLGMLLHEQGDYAGAHTAYQKAMESGHSDVVPRAALHLGELLKEQGDVAGAERAYQRAADSDHPDVVPHASLHLGQLRRDQGDARGAESAYRRAVDSEHPDVVPQAALQLGSLLNEQGDTAGAESAYQRAMDSGNADIVPQAALQLGFLLKERGDTVRAQAAYQRAADSGRADVVPVAALQLGMLFKERGDTVRAQAAYRRAIGSGRADVVPVAALHLGMLLAEQGDATGAETAYQQAIDSGDPDVVPMAALHRGALLAERGHHTAAEASYRQAIESGHADVAPRAANNLGVLLAQRGDTDEARTAYRMAIDSGHSDVAPRAANNLGMLLARTNDVAGAQKAYQQAIDSGHSDVAPRAALNLGMLLNEQGDLSGARAAYQRAIDSGHNDVVPVASINLGVLLDQQGDKTGARAAFHRAIDAGYTNLSPVTTTTVPLLLSEPTDVPVNPPKNPRSDDTQRFPRPFPTTSPEPTTSTPPSTINADDEN